MQIYVGCCGFAGGIKEYFKNFKTVEVQQTFYKIPQEKTLRKWKENASKNFIFNLKAFQGITHTYKSPTWKRFGEIPGKKENYGNLQPTKEVFESWQKTLKAAKCLNAKIILIQTPASFKDDKENLKNARKFFEKIRRNGFFIAFEPRGWKNENIEKFCKKFNLIHCVDPFKEFPTFLTKSKIAYFRLHGSYEKGKINYKHDYTKKELKELREKILNLKAKMSFVLFNNIYMFQNALEFQKLI